MVGQSANDIEQKLINAGWKEYKCNIVQLVDRQGGSWRIQDSQKVYINPKTGTIICLGRIQQFDPRQQSQMLFNQILQGQANAQHQHNHEEGCTDENCECHHQHDDINEEDIKTVMDQAQVDRDTAIQSIQQNGNVAEALTALAQQQ